jgi:pSer/pThr/pTyr-binding forkhead associated (FHA) protein
MLFAPPQPPMWVPRSRPVVIGRSSECDLTVPGRKSSRQHAEVRFEGDQVVIEDLGSTNGTFLNGEVLGEKRVLRPGDRIHIGGTTITFCHVDSQLQKAVTETDDDAAATVIFDGPPIADTGEALRGDLSEIPASAVLQVLEVGGKTGALGIVTDEGTNRIWLEKGRPVHAESPSREGTEAALVICRITEGRFVFDPGHPAPEASIKMSLTELLLESSRRFDESFSK